MADSLTYIPGVTNQPAEESAVVVEQEKLQSGVKDYIAAMANSIRPFSRNILGDRRHIETDIVNSLPKVKGWEAEKKIFSQRIHELLASTAVENINSPINVRLAVSSHRFSPAILQEPKVRATVLVCDSVNGIARQCVVPATDGEPQPLDHMTIEAGLMLTIQLLPTIFNEHADMRQTGMGSGMQYSERNRDPIERGDADIDKTGIIRPDLHKKPTAAPKKPSIVEDIALPLAAAAALHAAESHTGQPQHQQQHLNRATGLAQRVALGTAPTGWEHTSFRISAPEHIEFFVPENAASNLGEGGMFANAAAYYAAEGAESVVLTEKADEKEETEELKENETEEEEEKDEDKEEETTEEEEAQEPGSETDEEAVDGGIGNEPETVEFEEESAEPTSGAQEDGNGVEAINDAIETAGYESRIEPVAAEKEFHSEEQAAEVKTENKKEAAQTQQENNRDERREERTEARDETRKEQHENRVEGREDRHDLGEEKDNTQGSGPDHQHADETNRAEQKPEQQAETGEHRTQEQTRDQFEENQRPNPQQEATANREPNRYEELHEQQPIAGINRPERPTEIVDQLMSNQVPTPMGTEFHQTRQANFDVAALQPGADAAPNVLNVTTVPPPSSGDITKGLLHETAIHHLVTSGAATPTLATPTGEGLAALAGAAGMKATTSISRSQMRGAAKKVHALRAKKTPQARPAKKSAPVIGKKPQPKTKPTDPDHLMKPGQDRMG